MVTVGTMTTLGGDVPEMLAMPDIVKTLEVEECSSIYFAPSSDNTMAAWFSPSSGVAPLQVRLYFSPLSKSNDPTLRHLVASLREHEPMDAGKSPL
ncbi:hypothetical protein MTO96_045534 [Rhipicephalus appendiculatus]